MKVLWTEVALRRLAEIEEFISRDHPHAARRWSEQLVRKVGRLAEFPRMGRRVPEFPGTSNRELVIGNYRVVYRIRGEAVEVLTVFEAHRLPPQDLPATGVPDGEVS